MNPREKILAAIQREEVDTIPWTIYEWHLPRGEGERLMRNMGLGIVQSRPICREETSNVEVTQNPYDGIVVRTYRTRVGEISTKLRTGVGASFGIDSRDYKGVTPWTIEHPIKKPEDYDVMKFIIDNTKLLPYYDAISDAQSFLKGDGVVHGRIWRTPLQKVMIEMVGATRLFIHLHKYTSKVEELCQSLSEKLIEMCRIAADSPADFIWSPDNVDGVLTNPKLFEKYNVPVYKKMAEILRPKGKKLVVHMDGRLSNIAAQIANSEVDVVEACTPPPMGDLPFSEARRIWRDKVIWANFPATVCLSGPDKIERFTRDLLKSVAPGDGFLLGVTEDIRRDIREESLMVISRVMEKATYPLSP